VWKDQEEVDTSEGAHANWPDRFFAQITDGYLAATANTGGTVGHARSYLLDARGLLAYALPLMESLARSSAR
jgi:hypothetical protein